MATDVPSVQSRGDDNIILVKPQLVSNPAGSSEDPFDMFNDYIIDIPAIPSPAISANQGNEMVMVAPINGQEA